MPAEPTTSETGHAVNVAAGTYCGDPWLYLECGCGWRIGFDTVCDPRELSRAAAVHETVDA